jgi:hypothetical protein
MSIHEPYAASPEADPEDLFSQDPSLTSRKKSR